MLLCSATQVEKWFVRPALMELVTSLVDETECNSCLGNVIRETYTS